MVEATHENWPPRKFRHLGSLLNGKMAAEFRKKLCMRRYHVYNDIWETAVGEMLVCMREPRNAHDRYTVMGSNLIINFVLAKFSALRGPTKILSQQEFLCIR